MNKLTITAGIPGSGKTTFIENFLNVGMNIIISSDDIRREVWGTLKAAHDVSPEQKAKNNQLVWEKFDTRIAEALHLGFNVVADGTNLSSKRRAKLRDIAEEYGAECHLILWTNIEDAFTRNEARPDDLYVPEDVMGQFMLRLAITQNQIMQWETYKTVTYIA